MTDLFIIKNDKMLINWEKVFSIDEFKILKTTPQNPKWHFENFVAIHTMYAVNYALEIFGNHWDNYLNRIMVLSALFHDIGKGETTIFNKNKNSWSSPNHAQIGEQITRQMLSFWKYPPTIIEQVCFFVKYHMRILELYDSDSIIDEIKTIANERKDGICTIENLIKLKQCDCLASVMLEEDGWREKLEHIKTIAIQEKCLN